MKGWPRANFINFFEKGLYRADMKGRLRADIKGLYRAGQGPILRAGIGPMLTLLPALIRTIHRP